MNFSAGRFNLYLLLLAAGLLLAGGCATGKKSDKQTAALRVHIQSTESLSSSQTVKVLRSEPMLVPIMADPILTESHVTSASLVETPGGFAVEIQFNQTGIWMLEQYTVSNPGKHLVIFGQWSDKLKDGRWLAAPVIGHRIANGLLSFTPDASREEAEQFVQGLNNVAKKIRKQSLK
jgi:preprotein translocase subunit SecD